MGLIPCPGLNRAELPLPMKTADPELMRAINRFHVMDAIRRFGPVSRVEISHFTELSPTTVSAITAALLDDRLIIPDACRRGARRRPRPAARHAEAQPRRGPRRRRQARAGSDHGRRYQLLRRCAASLALPIRIDRQTAAVIADLVEDGVRRCVSDAELEMSDISGVCVGLPGVVERAAGICRQSPIFGERDVAFGAELTRRLGVPASIDSDVNLVTLAEHWFGQARELNDFLVVNVERSLGLGILHNGELFRGANGLSPDLGDLMVAPAAQWRRTARRSRFGGFGARRGRAAAARRRTRRRDPRRPDLSRRCCSARPTATRAARWCSPKPAKRSDSPSPISLRCSRRPR